MRLSGEDSIECIERSIRGEITAAAEEEAGGYVRAWRDGSISIELDRLSLRRLAWSSLLGALGLADRKPSEILDEAYGLLETARFGLEDMRQRPGRAKAGLRNAVVFGRMVTFALQNLRGTCPDFEEWYESKRAEMKADALMRYFHDLRTTIEKRATTPTGIGANIKSFGPETFARLPEPPPGADGFFIGDQNGGSGWIVRTETGEERYYVDLPADVAEVHLYLDDAPTVEGSEGRRAVDLLELYLAKIGELVDEARYRFAR